MVVSVNKSTVSMVPRKVAPLKKTMYPSTDDNARRREVVATDVTAQIIDETTGTAIIAKVPTITNVKHTKNPTFDFLSILSWLLTLHRKRYSNFYFPSWDESAVIFLFPRSYLYPLIITTASFIFKMSFPFSNPMLSQKLHEFTTNVPKLHIAPP